MRILYPFCQRINIFELFSVQHLSIKKLMMKISVNRDENIGVTLSLEETNKVSFRSLVSSKFSYSGPKIENTNMKIPKRIFFKFKLFQTIYTEKNKNYPCQIYPTNEYKNYGECDEDFIMREVQENFNITPFWAAKDMDSVTQIKYMTNYSEDEFVSLVSGEIDSPCANPCIHTKV